MTNHEDHLDATVDGTDASYVPVTFDDCDHVTGPFYHGTKYSFAKGDLVEPGHESNFHAGRISNHVYFAALPDAPPIARRR